MSQDSDLLRTLPREPVRRTPIWLMRQAGRHLPKYRTVRRDRDLFDLMREPKAAAEITT